MLTVPLSCLLGLEKRAEQAAAARELLRECEAMETEIAILKNKRTAAEVSFLSCSH